MLSKLYHPGEINKKFKNQRGSIASILQDIESRSTDTYHVNKAESQALTTSTADVFSFDFPATPNNLLKNRMVDITLYMTKAFGGTTTSNTVSSVEVQAPTGYQAIELGTATHVSNPATYSQYVKIPGDILKKIGCMGAVSTNATGTGSYAIRSIGTAYYNAADDHTYLRINGYPSNLVAAGTPATLYYSPFSFVSAGTWAVAEETTNSDTITYGTNYVQQRFLTNLGCMFQALDIRVRSKKSTSGHSISVTDVKGSLTSSI